MTALGQSGRYSETLSHKAKRKQKPLVGPNASREPGRLPLGVAQLTDMHGDANLTSPATSMTLKERSLFLRLCNA